MFSSRAIAQTLRTGAPRASLVPRAVYRGYASATDSKPPVALFGVDGTYASALYTAAAKTSALDSTAKHLDSLHVILSKDAKLGSILNAPSLSSADKSQVVQELLKQSGAASDKTMKSFLETLAQNNRLGVLAGVCEKFTELMGAHRGEVEMTVTSAAALDSKVLKQLETVVGKSQYVGQGKKLKVVSKVQPDIRGGLIVEIGDRTIDLSVSSKMNRMNKLLQDSL